MALFGKIFDKKVCDVCGGEIGLMGNRKLEDGNLCKNCAAKLSPWFSERKNSTVAEIQAQLAYREENQEKVDRFHTTRTLGKGTKVLLDEDQGLFMVTSASSLQNANPDVLEYSQVTGCDMEVKERRTELKQDVRDREGRTRRESYSPPRYKYSYDFYVTIHVNHDWFSEMQFQLNPRSVEVEYNDGIGSSRNAGFGNRPAGRPGQKQGQQGGLVGKAAGSINAAAGKTVVHQPGSRQSTGRPNPGPQPGRGPGYIGRQVLEGSTTPPPLEVRQSDVDYAEYEALGQEIKEALMQVRAEARENAAAASAPKTAVVCPYCGATTMPDENGCCEYCGSALA